MYFISFYYKKSSSVWKVDQDGIYTYIYDGLTFTFNIYSIASEDILKKGHSIFGLKLSTLLLLSICVELTSSLYTRWQLNQFKKARYL